MKKTNPSPSLGLYLDKNNHLHLKISLISDDPVLLEKNPFPFLIMADSHPLARVLEAKFVTDSGSELKKVFLLVQRDQYLLPPDDLRPLNNKDMEESWAKAFSFYAGKNNGSSLTILSQQLDSEGKLTPLQSLFYCKNKMVFFPPPCPKCGLPLELCLEDETLARFRLQPYSSSFRRYLFCPVCLAANQPDFYVYQLERDDPSPVKDRFALIREFSGLVEKSGANQSFPCLVCEEKSPCHGSASLALSRLIPFSFYPFYALLFEGMSMNALDFLAFISGATREELESQAPRPDAGRAKTLKILQQEGINKAPLLFRGSEKSFLEILYLKLAFLGEVFQEIFLRSDPYKYPDFHFSFDRLWVRFSDQGSLLPFVWDFKTAFIDLGRNPAEGKLLPKRSAPQALNDFGLIWFYTLLANKEQTISKIYPILADSRRELSLAIKETAFLPENIFWNAQGRSVPQKWIALWEKVLHCGWSFLEARLQENASRSMESLCQQMAQIREEIKDELFREEPLPGPPISSWVAEDRAIHEILKNILGKWKARGETKKEEVSETVILSRESLERSPAPPPEEKGGSEMGPVSETVILSAKDVKELSKPTPPGEAKKPDTDIPETIIFSPPKVTVFQTSPKAPPPGASPAESGEEDFLSETIIAGPKEIQDRKKDGTRK